MADERRVANGLADAGRIVDQSIPHSVICSFIAKSRLLD
jgi:hypothetical protein